MGSNACCQTTRLLEVAKATMTGPVIIIFFAQKYFIQGVSLTGMKE